MSFPVFLWGALARGPKVQTSKAMVRFCGSLACMRLTHCHFKKHMGTKCWVCISSTKQHHKHWCEKNLISHYIRSQDNINADSFELHVSVFACVFTGTSPCLLGRVAWACLWLWLSDCPRGMKPAALLGRINCWGRASAGATTSAKAKWNYTTHLPFRSYVGSLQRLRSSDSSTVKLFSVVWVFLFIFWWWWGGVEGDFLKASTRCI